MIPWTESHTAKAPFKWIPLLLLALTLPLNSQPQSFSTDRYPVKGIDVSHFQGNINWSEVEASGISFAIVKASEGYNYNDPRFRSNWQLANKTSIKIGAYHYFSLCRLGRPQAENFIRTVTLKSGNLPPVVDIEFEGNCRQVPSKKIVRARIKAYLESITDHYLVSPIIYTSEKFYNRHIRGQFDDYAIWFRSLEKNPPTDKGFKWTFWQYEISSQAGIKGKVDKNVFFGTRDQLENLCVP